MARNIQYLGSNGMCQYAFSRSSAMNHEPFHKVTLTWVTDHQYLKVERLCVVIEMTQVSDGPKKHASVL